jgi:transmembrane sensor
MSPPKPFDSDADRTVPEMAARWFVRLQDSSVTPELFRAWQEWLRASAEHRRAYEGVENSVWRVDRLPIKPRLPSADEMADDNYDGSSMPVVEWRSVARAHVASTPLVASSRNPLRGKIRAQWKALAAAATLACLSLGGGWLWVQAHRAGEVGELEYFTGAGTHRVIALSDGSRVTLDANSALSAQLTAAERSLRLDRGEAFFQVAKDSRRPFIVRVGSAQVRAVGTAFNVRMSADRTVVAVTEGKVEFLATPAATADVSRQMSGSRDVRSPDSSASLAARLGAGEAVSYVDDGKLQALPAHDAPLATAWLSGRRQYRNEPLRYVLADVDRYTGRRIEIADETTGDLKFTGTLNVENSEAWLKALVLALPVIVTQDANGILRVKQKK